MQDQISVNIVGNEPRKETESWIKLTTDSPADTSSITKAQLANFLNRAYGIIDHCTGTKADDSYSPFDPEDDTEKRLKAALSGNTCYESADLLAMDSKCNPLSRAGTPRKLNVYVHCSADNIRERYKFAMSSEIIPERPYGAESIVQVVVDLTDSNYAPVYRYAEEDEVDALWTDTPPQWLGDVLVGKRRIDPRTIGVGWRAGKIWLSQKVSGRLVMTLPIKYDVVAVSIPGVVIDGKRDYSATAFAFDATLPEPATLYLPDEQEDPAEGDDCSLCDGSDLAIDPNGSVDLQLEVQVDSPCQKRIYQEVRNECTARLLSSNTRFEPTPCPNKRVTEVTYTSAQTPEDAKWTAEEYLDGCCKNVKSTGCLPCKKIIQVYNGVGTILPSEQYWRDRYSQSQVFFNIVDTEDGSPCGTRTDVFEGDGCTDCTDVEDIIFSTGNPEVVVEGLRVQLAFSGGEGPYIVTITGVGFYLGPSLQKSIETTEQYFSVYADGSCGSADIEVQDACNNTAATFLRSSEGAWVLIDSWGFFDGAAGQVAECIIGKYKYYEDYCGRAIGTCPGTCTGDDNMYCHHPPYDKEICTAEGRMTYEWQCS